MTRVIDGLGDDREIQTLCILMLTKLMESAPQETTRRLDDIGEVFLGVVQYNPKENAVRHEHERADEAKRAVIRVSLELLRSFPDEGTNHPTWARCLDEMRKVKDGHANEGG